MYPTVCDPLDCSPPGPSVHGILQARILEWVAIPFSKGSSQRDRTQVSHIAGKFFYQPSLQGSLAVSVVTNQLGLCNVKIATCGTSANECAWIPIKLHLHKQEMGLKAIDFPSLA